MAKSMPRWLSCRNESANQRSHWTGAMSSLVGPAFAVRPRPVNGNRLMTIDASFRKGGQPMKPHFAMMARYNAWANARLYAEARAVSDESYRKDVGAFFRSLHGTLNHLLVTDRIWMRRFTGKGEHPLSSTQSCSTTYRRLRPRAGPKMVGSFSTWKVFPRKRLAGISATRPPRACRNNSFCGICWHIGSITRPIIAVKRTASSLFWEFRNPSHLISWQCIARCPRGIRQPVPNSRSNGRAASTMRYRPPAHAGRSPRR